MTNASTYDNDEQVIKERVWRSTWKPTKDRAGQVAAGTGEKRVARRRMRNRMRAETRRAQRRAR